MKVLKITPERCTRCMRCELACSVQPHWERLPDVWYETVGYDRTTGRPRPDTLRALGLEILIPPLWGT